MNPLLSILIVEDDQLVAATLEDALVRAGFGIVGIARTCQEALRLSRKKAVSLAVVDVGLARNTPDGVATVRALLQHQWMPIIYLTGATDDETFERAKDTYPCAFLNKPFREHEVVRQVQLALHRGQPTHRMDVEAVTSPLYLPTGQGYSRIEPADLYYLKGAGNFTTIYLTKEAALRVQPNDQPNKPLVLTGNLGYWGSYLPAQTFYRLSKSVIINRSYIDRIETHQLVLGMHLIPLSEGNRKKLLNQLRAIHTR